MLRSFFVRLLAPRPDFRQHRDWIEADTWYRVSLKSPGPLLHPDVIAYADARFREAQAAYDAIDKKAEAFFALVVAVAGAVLAAHLERGPCWPCLPGLLLLLAAMWLLVRLHSPGPKATPSPIRGVLEFAADGGSFLAFSAASMHCASVGLKVVTDWKAAQLRAAGWITWCGLATIALGACLTASRAA
jgi:hypothetical protein